MTAKALALKFRLFQPAVSMEAASGGERIVEERGLAVVCTVGMGGEEGKPIL